MSEPGEWAQPENLATLTRVSAGDDQAEEAPPLRFQTVSEFVEDFVVEVCWQDPSANSVVWCPSWWDHPQAIVRLEALWRAFEHLRQDPALGMSVWLRDHADPHMAVLLDPQGPFQGCSGTEGHKHRAGPRVMNVAPAPAGLFLAGD